MKILIILTLLAPVLGLSRKPVPASQYEQLTGKKLSKDKKAKWDKLYSNSKFIYGKAPSKFLSQSYQFIPFGSSVLDLGMGEGRNAVFLAQKGYQITGVDLSNIAVKKAQLLAKEFGVKIKTIVANLQDYEFPENSFDSIICFYWVDRKMLKRIHKWLKPGGVIIYEGYTLKHRAQEKEPDPVSYYLEEAELLKLFKDYKILKFEEANHQDEFRSSIIAIKGRK